MRFGLMMALVGWGALGASPVGNPAFPRIIEQGFFISNECPVNVRLGYEGNFVSDARLHQEKEGSGRVDDFGQGSNSAVLTANILKRLDVYGVLGSTAFSADWRFEIIENNAINLHRAQMETLSQFLWGFGAKIIFYESESLTFGGGGRYSFSQAEPVWLTIDAISQNVSGTNCRWNEGQFDLDFGFKIDFFTPYLGVKYSFTHVWLGQFSAPISRNDTGVNHFENRTPFGIFLGCTISNGKYFMLNVEARLVDEEAVTVSGDLRF